MQVRHRGRALLAALAVLATATSWGATAKGAAAASPTSPATWEQWLHLPGVFDLAGPRSDGRLVAAAHTRLNLVSPSGEVTAFAPSYSAPDGSESYIALSPGLAVADAACSFAHDELLALDLKSTPPGVVRISPDGVVSHLATVTGVSTLSGIALDTVGDFGHRLLVIGAAGQGKTEVAAIDCKGNVTPIATVATALEGGIAVAPRGFGRFDGELIAPNEYDGSIYAVSSSGQFHRVAPSGLPAGPDTGVESVGFVPAAEATTAYVADRGTPGNPHPGTDSVLRLDGSTLTAGGVISDDLLVATEGSSTLVDVRCAELCASTVVATGPTTAHGEGRLLIVAGRATGTGSATASGASPATAPPSDSGRRGVVLAVAAAAVTLLLAAVLYVVVLRRRRYPG